MRLPTYLTILMLLCTGVAAQQRLPIFDCHLHYSQDAWAEHSPEEIVARMDRAGVPRALVSSTPDDGTLKLVAYVPERFVPELRPYHGAVHSANWARDDKMPAYLAGRLDTRKYAGIGEFHLHDPDDAQSATMKAVVDMAIARNIHLHIHSNAEAVRRVFAVDPKVRILWAHAGMSEPANVVAGMLDEYPNLSAELSFRAGDIGRDGDLDPAWRELLMRHKDRFVIGSDTYVPSRFDDYEALIEEHRSWLEKLPVPVGFAIAYGNASRMFAN